MFDAVPFDWATFGFSVCYDIFKFIVSILIARWLYEGVYKKIKYGDWVIEMVDGNKPLASRKMTANWAERVLNDEYDFSVYVKGFASPFVYLNADVCSDEARQEKLIVLDKEAKKIIVDKSKNQPKQDS